MRERERETAFLIAESDTHRKKIQGQVLKYFTSWEMTLHDRLMLLMFIWAHILPWARYRMSLQPIIKIDQHSYIVNHGSSN